MNITLRQMRAFSAVSATGSFTLAARQLSLTQSAVSMLVQQLEEDVGLKLFDRARNAITLTEAGQQLLPLARRMLEDVRLFQDGAGDLKTLRRGVLRVAAPQLMACTLVAGVLAQFGQDFPDIGVRLVDGNADDVVAAVRRGDAELGIGPERPVGEDVTRSFLMNVPMRVICARTHRLAQRKVVAWHELGSERWVVYSSEFNRHLEQLLHMHDGSLTLQTSTEVEYLTTALALVGASTGIAAVPDYAHSFASNFGLHFLTVQAPSLHREYFVYQRRGLVLSPPAQEFAERLRCRALA